MKSRDVVDFLPLIVQNKTTSSEEDMLYLKKVYRYNMVITR